MNRKLGGLVFAALALPALGAESLTSLRMQACEEGAATAKTVMEHRQAGTAMSTLMKRIAKSGVPEGAEMDAVRRMIVAAYDSPRFGSEKYQGVAVRDFENEEYLRCVKSLPR